MRLRELQTILTATQHLQDVSKKNFIKQFASKGLSVSALFHKSVGRLKKKGRNMKYAEINKRYTQIVAEYITKGYQINSGTMSGSQGETAKVDFTDGKCVIRVMLSRFHRDLHTNGYEIIVGKTTDNIKINDDICNTIWNNRLEIIYCEKFYEIGEDRKSGKEYGTEKEAENARQKQCVRHNNKVNNYVDLTDKYFEIAKRVIKRVYNKKRVNKEDIKIYKNDRGYFVSYRYLPYKLH